MVALHHAVAPNRMKVFIFFVAVLAVGVPCSLIGLALFPAALHAEFYPIYLLVPYMFVDGKVSLEPPWFIFAFSGVQFVYFAFVIALWRKWRLRKSTIK